MNYLLIGTILLFLSCETPTKVEMTGEFKQMDTVIIQKPAFENPPRIKSNPLVIEERGVTFMPEPPQRFLYLKKHDSLRDLYHDKATGVGYEEIYVYLLMTLDTLSEKKTLKRDEDWGDIKWEQKFTQGITYVHTEFPESGGGGELYTQCKDKADFVEKITPVIAPIFCENCMNEDYFWNSDSTCYFPEGEGAGCYYNIKRTSKGFIKLDWYCGC